jgi:hypothetical protein
VSEDHRKEHALYDAIIDACDGYIGQPRNHEEEIVRVARVVTVLAHSLGATLASIPCESCREALVCHVANLTTEVLMYANGDKPEQQTREMMH